MDALEARLVVERFGERVDAAQRAAAPTKPWVRSAVRRAGASRCPARASGVSPMTWSCGMATSWPTWFAGVSR